MDNDLILIIENDIDLELADDQDGDLLLVDDVPSVQHYTNYTGDYTVSPVLHDDQQLLTKDKLLTDNLTVNAIPVTTTTNPYGGKTVVIG